MTMMTTMMITTTMIVMMTTTTTVKITETTVGNYLDFDRRA